MLTLNGRKVAICKQQGKLVLEAYFDDGDYPPLTEAELDALQVKIDSGEDADYHAVMNAVADEQELGNNADPIQPEDCDTEIDEEN